MVPKESIRDSLGTSKNKREVKNKENKYPTYKGRKYRPLTNVTGR
jgi:hypothetical protein